MKKLLLLLALILASPAFAANQWYQGANTAPLQSTTLINDIDTASQNYAFDPLNRVLANYRAGVKLSYATAATLTVGAGEIVVDSASSGRLMLQNTGSTTVTWADLDAGSEASATTYYVYAIGASSSATAITFKISASASAPTGVTWYKRIGSFYNDASSDITSSSVTNDNDIFSAPSYDSGWFAVSKANTYTKTHSLGTTKVLWKIYVSTASDGTGAWESIRFTDGGYPKGVGISNITTTTLDVIASYGTYGGLFYGGVGSEANYASGYARVIGVVVD